MNTGCISNTLNGSLDLEHDFGYIPSLRDIGLSGKARGGQPAAEIVDLTYVARRTYPGMSG